MIARVIQQVYAAHHRKLRIGEQPHGQTLIVADERNRAVYTGTDNNANQRAKQCHYVAKHRRGTRCSEQRGRHERHRHQ